MECFTPSSCLDAGSNFTRRDAQGKWVAVEEATQAALSAQLAGDSVVRVVAEDGPSVAIIQAFRARLDASLGEKLGSAPEALCHVRVPGSAAPPACGARGSDTAQVVAEAFLQAATRAQLAIQNAGGVRLAIPQGDISYDTAHNVLPYSNSLIEMEMTGAAIAAVLEDAVSNHLDPVRGVLGSDGSHPSSTTSRPRAASCANRPPGTTRTSR